jgi:hypothetical protein
MELVIRAPPGASSYTITIAQHLWVPIMGCALFQWHSWWLLGDTAKERSIKAKWLTEESTEEIVHALISPFFI